MNVMPASVSGASARWQRVRIAERIRQSESVISLDLVAADGGTLLPFEAGAHVDVRVRADITRPYSLCSDPCERSRYRLGVLREPDSRGGSAEIHRSFAVGSVIEVSAPRNNFALRPGASRVFLIAGGIGVTPLISMAIALKRREIAFQMHYCARSARLAGFIPELERSSFVREVLLHMDDGASEQIFDARCALSDFDEGSQIYVCGPGAFIDHVVKTALFLGWSTDQIHFERFALEAPACDAFTVIASRSGKEIAVAPGQRISDALAGAGIDVPMSCEAGVCGTCLTPVIEGEPDHRDSFQTSEEKAANDGIAVCCSGSRSGRLVLDI